MSRHSLTEKEHEVLRKLGTMIYDRLNDTLEMSEERLDEMARAACDAMQKFLEEGK